MFLAGPPTAEITKMSAAQTSNWQMRVTRENAIRVPSGDHDGWRPPELPVMLTVSEPSAFMTYTFDPPAPALTNAIFVPSGDHVGSEASARPEVSRLAPEPSALIT